MLPKWTLSGTFNKSKFWNTLKQCYILIFSAHCDKSFLSLENILNIFLSSHYINIQLSGKCWLIKLLGSMFLLLHPWSLINIAYQGPLAGISETLIWSYCIEIYSFKRQRCSILSLLGKISVLVWLTEIHLLKIQKIPELILDLKANYNHFKVMEFWVMVS